MYYKSMMSEEDIAQCRHAVVTFYQDIAEYIIPTLERFGEAISTLYECLDKRYKEAGSPYGDTSKDMLRWWIDLLT